MTRLWPTLRPAAILASLWLAGCAGTTLPAPEAAPAPAADPAPTRPAAGVAAFERRQLDAATRAQRRGQFADAALAWETLDALRPEHAPYREQLAAMRARIDAAVAERLPIAAAAQRRGDFDAAAAAYLEVLALQPTHPQAAEGLRIVERDRSRQRAVTRFAAAPMPRRAGPAPAAPLRAAGPEFSSSTVSNQLEHAALLAGAGEIDAAIHVLRGEQAARPSDAGVRSALADLHYRRAEQLQSRDRAAALQSLADCLALEPQHAPARQLQMRLRSTRPAGR